MTAPAHLPAMHHLTQRLWTPTTLWHIGDLAWTHHQHTTTPNPAHTTLWHTPDGHLAAWAHITPPATLDLHLDETHPHLADDILTWFH
ncbi:hypothetical protein, partial [Nonomuraea insulae]